MNPCLYQFPIQLDFKNYRLNKSCHIKLWEFFFLIQGAYQWDMEDFCRHNQFFLKKERENLKNDFCSTDPYVPSQLKEIHEKIGS